MTRILSAAQDERQSGTPSAAPMTATGVKDTDLTALEKLANLKDRGVLSEAEFEEKKREILARMSPKREI